MSRSRRWRTCHGLRQAAGLDAAKEGAALAANGLQGHTFHAETDLQLLDSVLESLAALADEDPSFTKP